MTPVDTEALERVCKAATPGPWEAMFVFGSSDLPVCVEADNGFEIVQITERCSPQPSDDVRHIATFNPAFVLELLAALKQRDRALAIARKALMLECFCADADTTRVQCDPCDALAAIEEALK